MDKVKQNIIKQQQLDKFNIEKSVVGTEAYYINQDIQKGVSQDEIIEKAKSGVYKLTAENKKMGRVGQKYGESKKENDSNSTNDAIKYIKILSGSSGVGNFKEDGNMVKTLSDKFNLPKEKIISLLNEHGKSEKESIDKKEEGFKVGDAVKFVKKNDKDDVINGKIVNVDNDKVKFINTDFPDAGESSFSKESLLKYYNVIKQ